MYNQTKVLEAQVLNGLIVGGPKSATDPKIPSNISAQVDKINALEHTYAQKLSNYDSQYNSMRTNMEPVKAAVDASHPDDKTLQQESGLLGQVINTDWNSGYKTNQNAELQVLQSIVSKAGTLVYT